MRYVLLGLAIAVAVILFLIWRSRKKKTPVPSPIPQRLGIRLLSTPPETMRIGEQYQVQYEIVHLPSSQPGYAIVNWRVDRDPRAPIGGPDIPCLYVDAGGKLTAIDRGERVVYAAFADKPEERAVSFKVTVI